jgi:predicted phage-related endonuclease
MNATIEQAAKQYRMIQAEIKQLEERAEAVKMELIHELDAQAVDEVTAGEYTVRYSAYETGWLDAGRLKAEQPDIYAAYTKRAAALRFQVA